MKTFLKIGVLGLISLGLLTGSASAYEGWHGGGWHGRGWVGDYHHANYGWYHHHYGFWRAGVFVYAPPPVYYTEVAYPPYYPVPAPVPMYPPYPY